MQIHALLSRPSRLQKVAFVAVMLLTLVFARFWIVAQAARANDPLLAAPADPAVEQLTEARSVSNFIASGGVVPDADPAVLSLPDVFAHAPASDWRTTQPAR